MNICIFCVGFQSISLESAWSMIKDREEFRLVEVLNNLEGVPFYAVGVHIINFWVVELGDSKIEEMEEFGKSRSMFFKLASQDPSFMKFEGILNPDTLEIQRK